MIFRHVIATAGHTPMVRLARMAKDLAGAVRVLLQARRSSCFLADTQSDIFTTVLFQLRPGRCAKSRWRRHEGQR